MFHQPDSCTKPNYTFLLPFEESYDVDHGLRSMAMSWPLCICLAILYVLFTYVGERYMRSKPAADLKKLLIVWNLLLSLLSCVGFLRSLQELSYTIGTLGIYHSICNSLAAKCDEILAFWMLTMTLLKIVELGDTAFIILRKKRLIFLHWYHHASVLVFTWYTFINQAAPGRWYAFINYFIHALMYAYYAVSAAGIKVPRPISQTITSLQILQMVVGVSITCSAALIKWRGIRCDVPWNMVNFALLLYFTYFLLFARLFYKRYVKLNETSRIKKRA